MKTLLDLVGAVNAAEANLPSAWERHELATKTLDAAEQVLVEGTQRYAAARRVLLTVVGADARLAALELFKAAKTALHDLRMAVQRARAEVGTSKAMLNQRTGELAAALDALTKAVPEEAP